MDPVLARRLENNEELRKKLVKLVQDYQNLAENALNYWADEFDTAHDILMCYAPLTKADLDHLEKGHPKRFVLPMSATQITTMTTFISQMLFGDTQPHKVEGRGPEDELPAEHVNQLLRWNSEQQPTYLLGYLWIQDILTFNRGIFYNSWSPLFTADIEMVEVEDPEETDEAGQPKKYWKPTRVQKPAGGYCRYELVSPYDFYCDPALPLHRLQEMRFCGHRTTIPWTSLKQRSKLAPDDPAYVLPGAVARLEKNKAGHNQQAGILPTTGGSTVPSSSRAMSRTAYERNQASSPTAKQGANKSDPGVPTCHEFWIRISPDADNGLGTARPEDETPEPVLYQFLIANGTELLAVNESTYKHGEFPYSVAEGRPNAHYQFSPSWLMMLKALQDYVDYLKNRHQEAISRTLGNIFIARSDKVNLADFLNPDKEGQIIPVLPEAVGDKLDDIIKQVPIVDTTKDFHKEMMEFVGFSETVTGANANMQGQVEGDGTATEFAGTQQMSAGRMSAVARLISVQGLVPQCRQTVSNYQQFLSESMAIRFVPNGPDVLPQMFGAKGLMITPDVIQGKFDFIAHDGTLPGTDNRKVAGIARLLEAAGMFPQFFTPYPGNIDARKLILAGAKGLGLQVENYQYGDEVMQQQPAPGGAPAPTSQTQPAPEIALSPELMAPTGQPGPGPGPGRPPIPNVDMVESIEPPQVRPQNY